LSVGGCGPGPHRVIGPAASGGRDEPDLVAAGGQLGRAVGGLLLRVVLIWSLVIFEFLVVAAPVLVRD
jgi:hypothetical protein